MMEDEIISRAKLVIKDNLYLTLSTVDKTGKYPLSTPLFYAIDNNSEFIYWVS
jgi:nitroimidazol reductase NimA-like FMN-containing flavoprotein (pyridoxamine 5'-phosphate oxidase superfamily)